MLLFESLDLTPLHSILWKGLHVGGARANSALFTIVVSMNMCKQWNIERSTLRGLEELLASARATDWPVSFDNVFISARED
jgi:hypothetical protein